MSASRIALEPVSGAEVAARALGSDAVRAGDAPARRAVAPVVIVAGNAMIVLMGWMVAAGTGL